MAYPNGYSYRRTITVQHGKVGSGGVLGFPMLFAGTYPYLKTVANGGKVQNANGYDIIVCSDAAGSTTLPFDLVSYNPTTGMIEMFVRTGALSDSVDTVLYLFYGNSSVSTSQANPANTWPTSEYTNVYHFGARQDVDQLGKFFLNNGPAFNTTYFRLVNNTGNTRRSVIYSTPLHIDADFTCVFTFQISGSADGMTWMMNGLGPTEPGFCTHNPGVGIRFNFYSPPNNTLLEVNGVETNKGDVSPVDINSNHQIKVTVTYNATTHLLSWTLLDLSNSATYSTSATVDIAGSLGQTTAWIGWSDATGGLASVQDILNWKWTGTESIDYSANFSGASTFTPGFPWVEASGRNPANLDLANSPMGWPAVGIGKWGSALRLPFDVTSRLHKLEAGYVCPGGSTARTTKLWFKRYGAAADACFFGYGPSSGNYHNWDVECRAGGSLNLDGWYAGAYANSVYSAGWHKLSLVYGAGGYYSSVLFYVDGILVTSAGDNITPATTAQMLAVGCRPNDTIFFGGWIEEVRIENVARGASWELTEFNSENDPSSFYLVGGESVGGSVPQVMIFT